MLQSKLNHQKGSRSLPKSGMTMHTFWYHVWPHMTSVKTVNPGIRLWLNSYLLLWTTTMSPLCLITFALALWNIAISGFPQKSQKKSSVIFPWLLQAKIQISRQKISISVFAAHASICRINYRQTQMHTHTQTHTRFDQGQPIIQLI